jgi:diaminopropionate ammonia-lyase
MGRLDCKEPSLTALRLLAREADYFATVSDEEAEAAVGIVADAGLATTQSGAAGVAALLGSAQSGPPLTTSSRVLCIISETTAS